MKVRVSDFIRSQILQITPEQAVLLSEGNEPADILSEDQLSLVKSKFRKLCWNDMVIWNAESGKPFPDASVVWIHTDPIHYSHKLN